jgi:exonuclease SbcC
MISYDYRLERDHHTKKPVVYTPTYPTELPNLVSIEGPNGSGKSTLLHLIALGCHGMKTGSVNDSLRRKIAGLLDASKQSLNFDFAISNDDGEAVLSARKSAKSADIELRDSRGKLMSSEQFDKKFKLVYDIPEDPLNRLEQLLPEIRISQMGLAARLRGLREACLRVQKDIEEARDPEKIGQREQEIRDVRKRRKADETRLEAQRGNLSRIQLFTALKQHHVFCERAEELKVDLAAAKRRGTEQKKRKKSLDGEYVALGKRIGELTNEIGDLYYEVSPLLESTFGKGPEKARHQLWREIVVREELSNPEVKQTLRRESTHFKLVLEEELRAMIGATSLEEARLIQELLNLVSRYANTELEIPGSGLSVQKFADVLTAELAKHQGIVSKEEGMRNAVGQLERILMIREQLTAELLPKWQQLEDQDADLDTEEAAWSPVDDTQVIERRIAEAEKKVEFYKAELTKLGVAGGAIRAKYTEIVVGPESRELHSLSEKDLNDRITGLEADVARLANQVSKDEANIDYLETDLEKLKKREPHKYQERAVRLREVLAVVQRMESRLNDYEDYIQQLLNKRKGSVARPEARDEYFEHVFEYLGQRVGKVRHVAKTYEVSRVDLLERQIVAKDGTLLEIDWLSTGEGQTAYLTGLLSGYDGRMMIALFDEVAMMDSISLGVVGQKMQELRDQGRLLIGVVAQKADESAVRGLT